MSEITRAEEETVDLSAETDQTNETSQEGEGQSQDVVSRSEYEALQKRLNQAEFTIEKVKKQKETASATSIESSKDNSDIVSQLREEFAADYLDDTLSLLSTDPVERERILDEYNTSIVKSGLSKQSIKSDLLKAAKLVRSDFNEKVARETSLAKETKQYIANAGGSSNQDKPKPQEDWRRYLNADDLKYMSQRKWSEEKMREAALRIKEQLSR